MDLLGLMGAMERMVEQVLEEHQVFKALMESKV
jgi:hypothetical protein